MKSTGKWILIIDSIVTAYALLFFNVAVDGYVNLGLMDERRNMLIVCGFGSVIGALLMLFGKDSEKIDNDELRT